MCLPTLYLRSENHILYFLSISVFHVLFKLHLRVETLEIFSKHENNHISAYSATGKRLLGCFFTEQCGKKSFIAGQKFQLLWSLCINLAVSFIVPHLPWKYPHHKLALYNRDISYGCKSKKKHKNPRTIGKETPGVAEKPLQTKTRCQSLVCLLIFCGHLTYT